MVEVNRLHIPVDEWRSFVHQRLVGPLLHPSHGPARPPAAAQLARLTLATGTLVASAGDEVAREAALLGKAIRSTAEEQMAEIGGQIAGLGAGVTGGVAGGVDAIGAMLRAVTLGEVASGHVQAG